jgi:outer membrane protein assembly factor BamB
VGYRHARLVVGVGGLLVGLAGLPLACSTATVRREVVPRQDYSAGVARMRWRATINHHPYSEAQPEECATGALVGRRLVLGSRGGAVVAVDIGTGAIVWSTKIKGGVDGDARYDQARGQVYVGSDDGLLYAIEPEQGTVRWSTKLKGPIAHAPEISPDGLYLSTGDDKVYAIDANDGKTRWLYDRDMPEGFTIHGYAAPRRHGDLVYAGFDDGYLVALRFATGKMVWSRSLAAASEEFVDVDATPEVGDGTLFAASFSGGVYGLRPKDGEVLWHSLIDGVNALTLGEERLYAASAREGVSALSLRGNILWRHGLPDAGDLSPPVEIGPYLVFSGSRNGLYILERGTGKLLQIFDPARGMCAGPTVDREGRTLYVLANSGVLYALDLSW